MMKVNKIFLLVVFIITMFGEEVVHAMRVRPHQQIIVISLDELPAAVAGRIRGRMHMSGSAQALFDLLNELMLSGFVVDEPLGCRAQSHEDSSMPLPMVRYATMCSVCKHFFDDGQSIAVLPCGHTVCTKCADILIDRHIGCLSCGESFEHYRTVHFFLQMKHFRDDTLEMPLMCDQDTCSVCLQPFEDCCDIAVLPCGHPFCCGCIDHALSVKEECPMCRAECHGYRARKFFKR